VVSKQDITKNGAASVVRIILAEHVISVPGWDIPRHNDVPIRNIISFSRALAHSFGL